LFCCCSRRQCVLSVPMLSWSDHQAAERGAEHERCGAVGAFGRHRNARRDWPHAGAGA
jgi:hypothetical protein